MKKFKNILIIFTFIFGFFIALSNTQAHTNDTFILNDEMLENINSNNEDYLEMFNTLTNNLYDSYNYILFKDKNNNLYLIRSQKEITDVYLYIADNLDRIGLDIELNNYTQYTQINENDLTDLNWIDTGSFQKGNYLSNTVYITSYKYISYSWGGQVFNNTKRYAQYNNYRFESGSYILENNNFVLSYCLKQNLDKSQYNSASYTKDGVEEYINDKSNLNNIVLLDNYAIYTDVTGYNTGITVHLITFTNNTDLGIYKYYRTGSSPMYFKRIRFLSNTSFLKNAIQYTLRYNSDNDTFFWMYRQNITFTNEYNYDYVYYSANDINYTGKIYKSTVDIKDLDNNSTFFEKNVKSSPSMNLKGMYNSNDEDIYEIGKVSVYFQESDSTIEEFKYAKFRLQYISNDKLEENIPIFSHFKIYGKINDESDAAEYEEINLNDFIYEDEDDEGNIIEKSITFEVGDTEYDYVPDKLAMSMLEFKLNFLENVNTIYEYWKIEFYFDNSQNATINVYDSLENSEWRNEPKFLDEYDFYYFPSNFKYAYISSENFENIGRVYFPTNSTINPEILLQAQYFNINTKTYDSPLEIIEYNDSFYSYIDFNFNNSTQLLVLNRLYGTETPNLNYFTGNIFLDWFSDILLNNFNAKKFFEYNKELTYFYVPKGYTVVFSDGKGTYQINTGNGFITIDENNNINIHEINENKKSFTLNSILDKFTNLLSDSTKHLKIVKDVWNKIIDSDIGIYILCVIISSIIILIVKSLKR